ncbi:hypothetical protein I4U23_020249 [Adineta vaga]|nr:hypothetical protein I4U23_020249 [Adineta vaga]
MTKQGSGSESCAIPYNVSFFTNTSINWNIWFCFENECPSNIDNKTLNCSSGKYSLIPFEPGVSNRTISINVPSSNGKLRSKDSQCLYYYYYITPLNTTLESNARIQVYMIDNNTELSISIATDVNMTQNSWQKSYVDIASSTGNYTVEFRFEYNIKDLETNETIYFALDDITVYDANCKHVREIKDSDSTTTTISSLPNKPDVGLALGFGLGLGLPFIFLIVLGSFCYMKKCRHKNTNNEIITKSYTSRTSINPYDYYDIQTTYF